MRQRRAPVLAWLLAIGAALVAACGGDDDGPVPDADTYRGLYSGTLVYAESSCPASLDWQQGLEVRETLEVATSVVASTVRLTGPTGRQYEMLGLDAMVARVEDGDLLADATLRTVPEADDCLVTFGIELRARLDRDARLRGTVAQVASSTEGTTCDPWVACRAVLDLDMVKQ